MTLRQQIAAILAGLALLVGAGAASAAYLDTSRQLRHSVDDTLTARMTALVSNERGGDHGGHGGHGDPERGGDAGCPSPGSFAPATVAQLVDASGAVITCIDGAPTLPGSGSVSGLSLRTVTVGGERYRVAGSPWPDGGTMELARSVSDVDSVLNRLRVRLAVFVLIAIAVAALLGGVVASWLVRPIIRLRDAAGHIAATLDLSTPVDVRASGEVGSLATSFSAMVDAVGRSQEQQRRLVADAGHEMRTPLTSLRSNLELMDRLEELPAVERREVVDDVLADVVELSTLLTELVDLASDLTVAEAEETASLGDLARAVAQRTERRTGRVVSVVESDAVAMRVRPRQIERAIANLVDNAVKYTPADTPIDVVIDGVEVAVHDRGPGVPAEDLPRIFDRFYRVVQMRTRPGSGLGLSIVEEIVRTHQGSVFAQNRDGGGLSIGFRLPGRAM